MKNPLVDRQSGQPLLPRMANFKPDEVFPIKDCVAVYDETFTEVSIWGSRQRHITDDTASAYFPLRHALTSAVPSAGGG